MSSLFSASSKHMEKKKKKEESIFFEPIKFALLATKSCSKDGMAEWYAIEFPDSSKCSEDPDNKVTLIDKPLVPFSRVRLAWPYREHAVIGSHLYSLGGMMTDSESLADLMTDKDSLAGEPFPLHRYYKVYSFDLTAPDDGWKAVAPMTFPNRFEPPCVVLDNKLYVLGALGPSFSEVEAEGCGWMEVYDPDLNTWEPLPNPPLGFPLSVRVPYYYATLDAENQIVVNNQILVALRSDPGSRFATFYIYHVKNRCWTCLEPPQRALQYYYPNATVGRRTTIVDDTTVYWGYVLGGIIRVQSHNIDTDQYFHGSLDTRLFFGDGEFEVEDGLMLPLLHLTDRLFCLFVFSFVDGIVDKIFLNGIMLNISLNPNPFKDEGKQEFDERYKYHFRGDSSKQLNISLVYVQKYPFDDDEDGFILHDILLLDRRPAYFPMMKKPNLSHETSVMDKLRL